MKPAYKPVLVIFLVVLGMVTVAGVSALNRPKQLIPWRTNWAVAQAEAQQTGKPLFAYFTADWCAPCQELKRTAWADADVEAAMRDYVPVLVDIDQQPELARKYVPTPQNLEAVIPAFRVVDPQGQIVRERVGPMAPEDFVKWLGKK